GARRVRAAIAGGSDARACTVSAGATASFSARIPSIIGTSGGRGAGGWESRNHHLMAVEGSITFEGEEHDATLTTSAEEAIPRGSHGRDLAVTRRCEQP